MEPKDHELTVLALATIWDEVDPGLLESALAANPAWANPPVEVDPLEETVRARVLGQITAGAVGEADRWVPVQHRTLDVQNRDIENRFSLSKFWLRTRQNPLIRMTAAAVMVLVIILIFSSPNLRPRSGSTTETRAATTAATTHAGATTAATTYSGTTAAAGTTAASTAAGTTAATTQAATAATTAATSAATTRVPTGSSQPVQIVWPMHLPAYLGFDLGQVTTVAIRRFQDNGSIEREVTLGDRKSLNQIEDLVNQIHLNKPNLQEPEPTAVLRYELLLQPTHMLNQEVPKEQSLKFILIKETGEIRIDGSFVDRLQIKSPFGLPLANPYLNLEDISSRLDALIG